MPAALQAQRTVLAARGTHAAGPAPILTPCPPTLRRDIFNVFLGAMLGGTILGELQTFVTEPSRIWRALGSAIPAASNFFINYISYRTFVMAAFRLFYPNQAIVTSILRWVHIMPGAGVHKGAEQGCTRVRRPARRAGGDSAQAWCRAHADNPLDQTLQRQRRSGTSRWSSLSETAATAATSASPS